MERIEGIRIGGSRVERLSVAGKVKYQANLLDQTGFEGAHDAWNASNGWHSVADDELCEGMRCVKCVNSKHPSEQSSYVDAMRQFIFYESHGLHKVEDGKWYTLSFWVKGTVGTGNFRTYTTNVDQSEYKSVDGNEYRVENSKDGCVKFDLTEEWTRHRVSFKYAVPTPTPIGSVILRLMPNDTQDAWVKIAGVKLEPDDGSHMATAWCPSVSDMES